MYNLADSSYLEQPRVMSPEIVEATVARAAEHASFHSLPSFTFVFHGGEPLLAGIGTFTHFMECALATFSGGPKPTFAVQTNGTLLTSEWCELLRRYGVTVGISLDGPQMTNDMNRVDHNGKGSYKAARKGWDLAKSYGLDPGLLQVININHDVETIYEHVRSLTPRVVDFLLPDATYDTPPAPFYDKLEITPYADWLLDLFSLWTTDESSVFQIKLFESIIANLVGVTSNADSLGPSKNRNLVIETDGSIEPVDVLKACRHGITKTPLNVRTNAFDEAFSHHLLTLYYDSADLLCNTCKRCVCKRECSGGYLPHRYRSDNAFDNPSIYCRDLMKLILGIQAWIVTTLPVEVRTKVEFALRSYPDARSVLLADSSAR
jgi:uncharacterized protein